MTKQHHVMGIIFTLTLIGCATPQQYHINAGNRTYKEGNLEESKQHFYKCSQNKVPVCMTKMGMINYEQGSQEEAIAWFKMAAKHGESNAISNLKKLNEDVPPLEVEQIKSTGKSTEPIPLLGLLNAMVQGYNKGASNRVNCTTYDLGGIYETRCK